MEYAAIDEQFHIWFTVFLNVITYFVLAFAGSTAKDMYDGYTGKKEKTGRFNISIGKIMVSALLSSFIMYAISPWIPFNWTPLVNFLLGIVGWELFERVSTIHGLMITAKDASKFVNITDKINSNAPDYDVGDGRDSPAANRKRTANRKKKED